MPTVLLILLNKNKITIEIASPKKHNAVRVHFNSPYFGITLKVIFGIFRTKHF